MPSNIIEITNTADSDPDLHLLSDPPCEEYAALSYCWGGDQPVKATTSSLRSLKEHIEYTRLPKTLKDAVMTTRKIGLRFLWVDSLCVIQDDPVQARREIARMPKIYQNAYVTISAARCISSKQGFLQGISAPGADSIAFQFSFRGPDDTTGTIICFYELDRTHTHDPINKRAWALQEQILSPRILWFGSYRLTWRCRCSGRNDLREHLDSWWTRRERYHFKMHNCLQSEAQTRNPKNCWDRIVFEYSQRNLSEETDKLRAISGIAMQLGQANDLTYMAGIWREHFPTSLLWQACSYTHPRPSQYRAPSWSWAAIDGAVNFRQDSSPDPELKFIASDIVLKDPQVPYGDIEKATISIQGWLAALWWTKDRTVLSLTENGDAPYDELLAFTFPDAEDITGNLPVWCLQVGKYEPGTDEGPHGLILATEDGRTFNRLGSFKFDMKHEEQTVESHAKFRRNQESWSSICELKEITIE